jgi:cyclophilin family peptidyl-prolyl cis-trans isomerase
MAQHKAPTAVTLAPREERGFFGQWIEKNWKVGLGVAVLIGGAVLVLEYSRHSQRSASEANWDRLLGVAVENPQTGALEASPEALMALATELAGSDPAPWALYLAAINAQARSELDQAQAAIARLQKEHSDHPLVRTAYAFQEGSAPQTIPERLQQLVDAQRTWREKHPELYSNPELPTGSPRVRLVTDSGPIVLGLYADKAPKHVENFMKLCREGFYDGTKFHRVVRGFMIQGGDPNSRDGAPDSWGAGGPGYQIAAEDSGLAHFAGYLSAAKKPGEKESSGSQFFITTADAHHLDGQHVVFGIVQEGLDVVERIEASALVEGTDRPVNPVTIRSTEIL